MISADFGQVPLQMAGQSRAVVEHAEQDRRPPFAARRQHLARTVVAVPMPEPVHVCGLVAAYLTRLEPGLGGQRAGGLARRHRATPGQATGGEESPDRRVGWHRAQLRAGLGQGGQIVVMQLSTPALVGVILGQQGLAQRRGHRCLLTSVLAPFAAQHADRVVPLIAGTVKPSLQGRDAEADRRTGAWVSPLACRQLPQCRAQCALRRRCSQQLTDHRKAQLCPALMHPRAISPCHAQLRKMRGSTVGTPPMAGDEHPLRIVSLRQNARIADAPPVNGPRNRNKAVS